MPEERLTFAFALLADGAVMLDWEPIFHAGAEAVPKGRELWLPTAEFDFPSLTWSARTNDENGGKINCCVGKVTVGFVINKSGRIAVTRTEYDPAAQIP